MIKRAHKTVDRCYSRHELLTAPSCKRDSSEHQRRMSKQMNSQDLCPNYCQPVLDTMSDLVQRLGMDGRVTFANRSWLEMMGCTVENAQQLSFEDLLPPYLISHWLDW